MIFKPFFNEELKIGLGMTQGWFVFFTALLFAAGPSQAENTKWVTQENLQELVDPALVPPSAQVEVKFVKAEQRIGSLQCPAALFANTNGNKMWGRTFVSVQCVGVDTPPFFMGVDVKVWAPVLVIKNAVQAGQTILSNDVEYKTMDLSQLGQGWVSDMTHLHNRSATRQLWPGTLLKQSDLRGQSLMKQGDTVKVMVKGPGFTIGGTAVAMDKAEFGEVVKIKTSQGKFLHGVARDALLVEVN